MDVLCVSQACHRPTDVEHCWRMICIRIVWDAYKVEVSWTNAQDTWALVGTCGCQNPVTDITVSWPALSLDMPNRNKSNYEFSLAPITKNNIPPLAVLIESANALLASSVRWPPGKTFCNGLVQTFSHKEPSGPNWHGRLSYHPIEHGTFHDFWQVIGSSSQFHTLQALIACNISGVRHSQAQEEYVPELVSATHLEPFLDGDYNGWTYHYTYSPPVSPRTFTVLLATVLDDKPPRQGWVINIPFDVGDNEGLKALEEKGVRGRFTSVERLLEVNDQVEWMGVTMYQIGGSIPNFISERQMPKQLAERVPQVLEYMDARRAGQSGRKPKLVSRSSSLSVVTRARKRSVQALFNSGAGTSSAPSTAADGAAGDASVPVPDGTPIGSPSAAT
ncbi:hypothetical protein CTheo_4585 [Ceratobasidium theobromae]|uniref:DUF3074 domain-containing protein n=1 Tax=Ceratobasidium theobromae TaxID=1582974 RepID=A0A5N5QK88_9AGAM|nr:hypothetical protein CTheo_4585 [Ceratobasidium theobromae]